MRSRDENVAIRGLIAAVETQTEILRAQGDALRRIDGRLDSIDGHISVLIDTVAEHIAHHGEAS